MNGNVADILELPPMFEFDELARNVDLEKHRRKKTLKMTLYMNLVIQFACKDQICSQA